MPKKETTDRLLDTTYDTICASLSSGLIKPGDWLRQASIAEELNVSQVTVRDALNKLVADGLAERVPRKGVRIPYISLEDLVCIYEMRIVAEGLAWQLAAQRVTDHDLKQMRELLPYTGTTGEPSSVNIARQKNHAFHMIAIRASDRWTLIHLLSQLLNLNNLRFLLSESTLDVRVEDGQINIQEHAELLLALENKNPSLARELIVNHIQRSMTDRLSLYHKLIKLG